ncbi:Pentatricopeptide repeat-containing protein [Diplonema papillatum]|nr:Pentatricopeptide repeat-containing protein [Diplonema papillatum]
MDRVARVLRLARTRGRWLSSLETESVALRADWLEEGTASVGREDPFGAVLRFLHERKTTLREASELPADARERVVREAIAGSASLSSTGATAELSVRQATSAWASKIDQGDLAVTPLQEAKLRGMAVVARIEQAVRDKDPAEAKKQWRAAIADLQLPDPVINGPFLRTCKAAATLPVFKSLVLAIKDDLEGQDRRFDLRLYTSIMLCSDYTEARRWFKEMRMMRIRPDSAVFGAAMKGCEKMPDAVANIFSNMRRAGIDATEQHFCILLRSHHLAGQYSKVDELWASMDRWHMRKSPISYAVMVKAMCDKGDLEAARGVLDEAVRRNLSSTRAFVHLCSALPAGEVQTGLLKLFVSVHGFAPQALLDVVRVVPNEKAGQSRVKAGGQLVWTLPTEKIEKEGPIVKEFQLEIKGNWKDYRAAHADDPPPENLWEVLANAESEYFK